MGSLQEEIIGVAGTEEQELFLNTCVVYELNRLHNQLKAKDGELGDAHAEIKALRLTQLSNNKAIQELNEELTKLEEKLRANENLVEFKNLETKKLKSEKKEALAAQYAAEATLRRVHVNQKDHDFVPIEAIIAPLEASIKIYKKEIAAAREDKKALERATKSKESALVEADQILKSALERALIVEEVQNHNIDLKRQLEICQEENKLLDKTYRQKVSEVEKLSQSIRELEESILAAGAAANAVRGYQRHISQLNEEKKVLEREVARAKVSVNRVATVVSNDKVIPVKQWLEERRFMQSEMQRLKDKLSMSERRAKAETQLKEKFKLRLKTLEEGMLSASQIHKSNSIPEHLNKRSRGSPNGEQCSRSDGKENTGLKTNSNSDEVASNHCSTEEDVVSGFLYDRLQREVIHLQKHCQEKESALNAKDEEIKMLMWKVDALGRAIEIESRKLKRETRARERELVVNNSKNKRTPQAS